MGTIYRIRNLVDGKVYIGQAVNFEKRKSRHLWELRSNRHTNEHLQRAWLLHGEANFIFEILANDVAPESLVSEEQRHIDAHQSADFRLGYNKSPAAGSNLGVKYSEASKLKISAAHKGRPKTDEQRRRISETLTGKVQSAETIAKRVSKIKGLPRTAEWSARLRDAQTRRNGTLPLTAFGKTQHINDWAKEYGINTGTLRNRLKRSGMPLEEALTAGNHKGRRKDLLAS
ncbi:GIY-YIG nuclease family protein [Paraburkholderia sp. J11-2]|uniref:GIY-YIG nuclease family protein n=1 Tax=Paraburkholderia sp. J11-2 TaxID=2805431 RepID=UPI002AB656A1|nr:GIY-YIG nuclease family protein [Paraburkholderia sp. J11-2]